MNYNVISLIQRIINSIENGNDEFDPRYEKNLFRWNNKLKKLRIKALQFFQHKRVVYVGLRHIYLWIDSFAAYSVASNQSF